jgi:ribonuclease HI
MKTVELFADGSCQGNPGPGGWAAILRYDGRERELVGYAAATTNNRMELQAVIEGLRALKRRCTVAVYSDSRYVVDGAMRWLAGWKRNGFRTAAKQPVANVDLWTLLDAALNEHDVAFHWVRGHAGHPENERCDQLARAQIERAQKG